MTLGAAYRVQAINIVHASENKIHDDAVARRLGFSGGLVAGIEVYAYATHAAVTRWGRDWLERGTMDILLKKPVYDGHEASVTSEWVGAALEIRVESAGALCASGIAALSEAGPAPAGFAAVVPPAERPVATAEVLPPGRALGSHPFTVTAEVSAQYLRDVGERDPLYAGAGLVHPGTVLRVCNWVLMHSVRMEAWIHAGSRVQNFAAAGVGDTLTGRATVLATYERKGHQMVDLDVLVVADGERPIARVMHTAIYRPRLAEAA